MGYKLCTAEKPSVAADIARVIGAAKKEHGYFIGNGFIVTWAVGHLVGLAEPEDYGYVGKDDMWDREQPEKREQAYNELPLIPKKFQTVVLEPTKEQFQIIKNLMNREDVDYIIDCGDMGAEGHILQWLIREKAGNRKPVKRFCATSMTDEAIKEAMSKLRNIEEFEPIIVGEYCKKRADWILGMSVSRCASIKYSAHVDVGRVQSPTLYFILKRFLEVNSFKPTNYFTLKATLIEGYNLYWQKDIDENFKPTERDSENRLLSRTAADEAAQELKVNKTGIITSVEIKQRVTDRPQLYDITELQRDGNRLYGYTADSTLQIAQSLYETHKVLSYPRTDSRYITSDLQPYMSERIKQISSWPEYSKSAKKILSEGLLIDKKVVDDKQVTDHHALIVMQSIGDFDPTKLNEQEKSILHLVIVRMLVVFSQKFLFEETIIKADFKNGMVFTAGGKKPLSWGWKAVHKELMGKVVDDGETENEAEQLFPKVEKGNTVSIKEIEVVSKTTTAPKLHTEATLLTAMESAGSQIENGNILKGRGIGTQATRAAIIKSLFDKKYISTKGTGKTNYLLPTKQGINVIKVIPSDLYSPKTTADWEEQIARIVSGTLTESDFLKQFETYIRSKIVEIKTNEIKNVDFSTEKEEFAKCPWCGAAIYEVQTKGKSGKNIDLYYCSAKCGFSIGKDNMIFVARTKKNLSTVQMRKLITSGVLVVNCINKNNVKYQGKFTLSKNDKGYATLEFSFAEESKKQKNKK